MNNKQQELQSFYSLALDHYDIVRYYWLCFPTFLKKMFSEMSYICVSDHRAVIAQCHFVQSGGCRQMGYSYFRLATISQKNKKKNML